MVKNKFVVEVGDTEQLKQCISRLRNVGVGFRRVSHYARGLTRSTPRPRA